MERRTRELRRKLEGEEDGAGLLRCEPPVVEPVDDAFRAQAPCLDGAGIGAFAIFGTPAEQTGAKRPNEGVGRGVGNMREEFLKGKGYMMLEKLD